MKYGNFTLRPAPPVDISILHQCPCTIRPIVQSFCCLVQKRKVVLLFFFSFHVQNKTEDEEQKTSVRFVARFMCNVKRNHFRFLVSCVHAVHTRTNETKAKINFAFLHFPCHLQTKTTTITEFLSFVFCQVC